MKKMLGLVGSILGLFLFSILFFLTLNGMLVPRPPFLRAGKGYVAQDSTSTSAVNEKRKTAEDRQGQLQKPEESVASRTNATGRRDSLREDTSPPLPEEIVTPATIPVTKRGRVVGETDTAQDGRAPQEVAASEDSSKESAKDVGPFDPEKMARLVRVYEKMRPKQVGLILDTMPDAQSVAVLRSMKDRAAAQVMAAMEPSKAARMSRLLVERGRI